MKSCSFKIPAKRKQAILPGYEAAAWHCSCFAGPAETFILDEPTNGLDPIGIQDLRELIRSFPTKGITVILSSHILSEVELIADHIGILSNGKLGYESEIHKDADLELHLYGCCRQYQRGGLIDVSYRSI